MIEGEVIVYDEQGESSSTYCITYTPEQLCYFKCIDQQAEVCLVFDQQNNF